MQETQEEKKEITEKQQENSKVPAQLLPFAYKKGQSGNPEGRPKGKTLKEYCKDFLACMTEEERQEFLNGLSKETIWKMAEGNPQTDTTVKGDKEHPIEIKIAKEIADNYETTSSPSNNSEGQA